THKSGNDYNYQICDLHDCKCQYTSAATPNCYLLHPCQCGGCITHITPSVTFSVNFPKIQKYLKFIQNI
ncbi:9108_t:CDS:1, partial [Racocetra persica]